MTAETPLARARSEFSQAEQAFDRADFPAALELYRSAVEAYTQSLGAEHRETAQAQAGVGKALNALGEYAQARPVVEQALAIQRRGPGPMRPEAAASQHLLGEIISNKGDLASGERLVAAAYRARRLALGPDHPDTLDSQTMWGALLFRLGKTEEAEPCLVEGANRSRALLGDAHRVTARALLRLGLFYTRAERTYPQARLAYERALQVSRSAFGPLHPFTALVMNNLAALQVNQGEIGPARDQFRSSLALHETIYGPQHPLTGFVLFNIGDVYTRLGDHPSAFTHLARAWVIWMPSLGVRHAQTRAALNRLVASAGRLEQEGGDATMRAFGMGLHICLMALQAAEGSLEADSRNLPGVYLEPERAVSRLEAWAGRLGSWLSHPPISPVQWKELEAARRQVQEAAQFEQHGDYPAAQAALQAALAIQERVLGADHLKNAALLSRLAVLADSHREPNAALRLLERSTQLHDRLFGKEHPFSLDAFLIYVQRYEHEYGMQAALPHYRELRTRHIEAYGGDDPNVQRLSATIDSFIAQQDASASISQPADAERVSRSERTLQSIASLAPERLRLLDGIDRIDWRSVQDANGAAVNTPDILCKLLTVDPQVRDEGWQDLYSRLWREGTVNAASVHAIPFLLRMLASEPPPEKIDVLTFLAALATGSSYLDVHAIRGQSPGDWNEILAKMGRGDLQSELAKELDWVRSANDAVASGIPVYLELLERGEPEVQKRSAYTLACLPRYAARIVPGLLKHLPRVQSPLLRLAIVRALRSLMDAGPEARQVFTVLLNARESRPVRFEAAGALVERMGERASEAAVNVLLEIWRSVVKKEIDLDLGDVWPLEAQEEDLRVLLSLGAERGCRALLNALAGVNEPKLALDISGVLLDLVFNQGQFQENSAAVDRKQSDAGGVIRVDYWSTQTAPERRSVDLTDPQRRALKELVDHPAVWRAEHNLLRLYGLPSDRKRLRRFLAA